MTYVMSDIHGMYSKYIKMLEKINFSDDDELFIIGDVVDRGDEPINVLLDMMERPNIFPIMGNHDLCAVRVLSKLAVDITDENSTSHLDMDDMGVLLNWQLNGGTVTMKQFGMLSKEKRADILEYMSEFSMYEVIDAGENTFILVHAGLGNFRPDKKLKEYTTDELLYYRTNPDQEYFEDKSVYVVTGHTPVRKFTGKDEIIKRGNNILIDCGAVFNGKLACLCLETFEEFYV